MVPQSGFGGGFDTTNEGWFGSSTVYGGNDKLGHMYVNYADVRLLSPLFESAGTHLLADGVYGGHTHSTAFQRGTDRQFDLVQFPTIGYARRSLD